jgi:putative MFS transporter
MYNYDHLLSERLKFGAFQLRTFSIVSFIDFLDGAEIQFLSFLNVILLKEWELDMTGLVLLAGSLNFGLFIGAIICIFVADRYGRRNVIVIGSFV